MNVNPTVTIMMATFNGEAFIKEQLDSLIRQTYPSWKLVVHDDGSTDNTLDILAGYERRDPRITVMRDGVTRLGATGNFMHLLSHTEGELYMFCDQDDIWLEHKVTCMVETMRQYSGPTLVYANANFYKNGGVVEQKTTTIHPTGLRNFLFFNSGIQGCSIMINAELINFLRPFPSLLVMHDHLFTLGAISFGKVVYLDKILMWYRQHGSNASGAQHLGVRARWLNFFRRDKPVVDRHHFLANRAFYRHYLSKLTLSDKQAFNGYFRYCESKSRVKRILIILKHRFSLGDKIGVLFLKTLIRKPIG